MNRPATIDARLIGQLTETFVDFYDRELHVQLDQRLHRMRDIVDLVTAGNVRRARMDHESVRRN